jgi:hypothetical protein
MVEFLELRAEESLGPAVHLGPELPPMAALQELRVEESRGMAVARPNRKSAQ